MLDRQIATSGCLRMSPPSWVAESPVAQLVEARSNVPCATAPEFKLTGPQAASRSAGFKLFGRIGPVAVTPEIDSPARADHGSAQVLAVYSASCHGPAIPVPAHFLAGQLAGSDEGSEGIACFLAAGIGRPVPLALLMKLRSIDAEEPEPLITDSETVAVSHGHFCGNGMSDEDEGQQAQQ
jgi:hypothetical protein